jgi:hypothetical protein
LTLPRNAGFIRPCRMNAAFLIPHRLNIGGSIEMRPARRQNVLQPDISDSLPRRLRRNERFRKISIPCFRIRPATRSLEVVPLSDSESSSSVKQGAVFPTTRWSLVLSAANSSAKGCHTASPGCKSLW